MHLQLTRESESHPWSVAAGEEFAIQAPCWTLGLEIALKSLVFLELAPAICTAGPESCYSRNNRLIDIAQESNAVVSCHQLQMKRCFHRIQISYLMHGLADFMWDVDFQQKTYSRPCDRSSAQKNGCQQANFASCQIAQPL